jgi:hypothetical protein
MRCTEFEARLNEVLDERGTLDQDAALSEHAGQCADCRETAASLGLVLAGVDQLPWPRASDDLAERVIEDWQPRHVLRFTPARVLVSAMAIAASLLIGTLLWRALHQQQPTGQANQLAHSPVAARSDSLPKGDPATVADPARAETDAYWQLARETQRSLASALRTVPGSLDENSENSAADESGSDDRWVEVRAGLEPLTRGTAGAFNSLWQILPPADEDSRS